LAIVPLAKFDGVRLPLRVLAAFGDGPGGAGASAREGTVESDRF